MRGQSGGTAKSHATGFCTSPAFIRASIYQLALKLSDTAENGEHEPAMGRCRIAPGVFERFEANATLAEIVKDIQQVAGRASEPIEARHMSTSPSWRRLSSLPNSTLPFVDLPEIFSL